MNLHEKLSLIQQEFKAKKSRYNSFGKYNFRSAEDILEGLKPFNKKYGVYFTVTEEPADTFASGDNKWPPMIVSKAAIHDGETKIEAAAVVGIDLNQKGMQTPQQFGSASSYGKKYALGNLLLIDDTADADATNNHGRGSTISGPGKSPKVKPRIDESNIEKAFTFLKNGGKIETLQQTYLMDDSILQKLKNG